MKVYLESLGCKLNQCERDALAREFAEAGHTVVLCAADADVCVVNTCAVTHVAARKSRQRFRRLHVDNPSARLVATGCYASLGQNGLVSDLSIPNAQKRDLVSLIEARTEAWGVSGAAQSKGAALPKGAKRADVPRSRTRPMVQIQDGCDNTCTYCIVHVLRGKQRSRPRHEIVDEVTSLVEQGYREVVLTGVHVGAYGRDSGDSLTGLVRAILAQSGPERLRLSSIEPWDLSPAFLDLWQDLRLCRHLHLPLQSGCDETLRRMGRPYTTAGYAQLVARAREAIPGLAVTTDLIAGFPGETEETFAASAAFVEQMAFARAHVFAFSPRPGTPAADMPDQIIPAVRRQRAQQLRAIASRSGEAFRSQFLGSVLPVLWETRAADGRWSGLTDNYIRVRAHSEDDLANAVRETELCALEPGGVQGRLSVVSAGE